MILSVEEITRQLPKPERFVDSPIRRAWVATFCLDRSPDPAVLYPRCDATIWDFGFDAWYVLLGDPVFVGRELPAANAAGSDEQLTSVLARWPTPVAVNVVNVGTRSSQLAEQLRQAGLPVRLVEPTELELSVRQDTIVATHPEFTLAGDEWPTDRVEAWLRSCNPAVPVVVHADSPELRSVCEQAGLSWRPLSDFSVLPVDGAWARGDSLSARFTLDGGLSLTLDFAGQSHVLPISLAVHDGWSDLLTAAAIARDDRSVFCALDDEPDTTEVVFDTTGPELDLELWRVPGGFDAHVEQRLEARAGQQIATWRGSTAELAVLAEASRNLIDACGRDLLRDAYAPPPLTPPESLERSLAT